MIQIQVRGSFQKTDDFLSRMKNRQHFKVLEKYGPLGVAALKNATPKDKALTADSWYYEIEDRPRYFAIRWLNRHLDDDGRVPVAILIQYGHATGTGGTVEARDFINPAMRTIFEQMANDMWKEVTR